VSEVDEDSDGNWKNLYQAAGDNIIAKGSNEQTKGVV